jgi:3' exoribonuclease, RNase T-like
MTEIFVSTDVETDGPIPGPYSMLSLGSAAFLADKTLISTFYANLETLPGASQHPDTMKWWQTQPQAWEASRVNPQPPEAVMRAYGEWLRTLPGLPVFVGYPVAFDYMFVQWYLINFTGESPFSYVALDIKTFAWALLNTPFHETTKSVMPPRWFDQQPELAHHALEDALDQGRLFCNMLAEHMKGQK